ncbi:MAG: 2-oxo acid dehydrogenase subunit E2 [Gammaproteobacteria bacterium]|nr:2-oxo acid dehydrogenase subunit E2 [Gammaproteobacteria bacterium]MBT8437045.1 2-oxo acid dehydrogenase subunit E2 [Gammaproteobacteria bacterium]
MNIFKLPDLGEGLPDAEIVEWHVEVGDEVEAGQTLVSVETAKAIIDIPSPQAGRIAKLFGGENAVIETGQPLLAFGDDDVTDADKKPEDSGTVVGEMESTEAIIPEAAIGLAPSSTAIKATPAVRALANRMSVELSMVTPSGRDGLILADDVRRVARILAEHGPMEPLRGVRRAMSRNMAQAHAEVAPATLVEDADVTAIESSADITPRLIRALIAGCKAEPSLNAWYDSHANGRRVLERIHLGLAVDAPQGLFVAALLDIQNDDDGTIVKRLSDLKEKIKNRSLTPAELRGYSITLSNYGAISGRYASPVVLPPTVAILGAGKSRDAVVARHGEIVIRHILPLALTFDHRAVTGGEAARFMKAVVDDLEN